jgi:hypothetical protein
MRPGGRNAAAVAASEGSDYAAMDAAGSSTVGYSYSFDGKLCCDACGKSGGVRKRTCPYRVNYADGGSLPYCYPAALCGECYRQRRATLHTDCGDGAAKRTAAEADRAARLAAGDLEVRAAFGSWHQTVPDGFVGVLFRGSAREERRLIPAADYNPGIRRYLSEYAETRDWTA